ncbi:hypothetical protein HCJ57_02970 [Listeria booriae]|uniref:Uncharacterized protein n=1 Tax=Listeria booriae TaxID=1552123 RepID=A0A099WIT7_9LIST|nr:hypothetical protein [Listeria booriae]KGL44596.1 hypothetical protein EP57_01170 [Listeria booriae]MBC2055455.1 hypothetical protein [Listeria booriae]STY40100.1 Uncharacterised protein [Listeria booriae]
MDQKMEALHQQLQKMRREKEVQEDALYVIRQKQVRLESVESELFHMEREKSNLVAQAHEVWQGNHGRSVAHEAEDIAHQNWRQLRRTVEDSREALQQEQKRLQNNVYQLEEEQKRIHKELLL